MKKIIYKIFVLLCACALVLPVIPVSAVEDTPTWFVRSTFDEADYDAANYTEGYNAIFKGGTTLTFDKWVVDNQNGKSDGHLYYQIDNAPNGYLSFGRKVEALNSYGIGGTLPLTDLPAEAGNRFRVDLRVLFNIPEAEGSAHGANATIGVYGMSGGKERRIISICRNTLDGSIPTIAEASSHMEHVYVDNNSTKDIVIENVDITQWYDIRIDFDLSNNLCDIYVGDSEWPVVSGKPFAYTGVTELTRLNVSAARFGKSSEGYYDGLVDMGIDDFEMAYLPELDTAQRLELDKQMLAQLPGGNVLKSDFSLPSIASFRGTNVTWSTDISALSIAGRDEFGRHAVSVLRPAPGEPDATGTLTASLSNGGQTDTLEIPVTIPAGTAVSDLVQADMEALELPIDPSAITENFVLPAFGENGSSITWTSPNSAIAIGGMQDGTYPVTVTRPREDAQDAAFDLTATFSYNGYSDTLTIPVTVVKYPTVPDDQKVPADLDAIRVPDLSAVTNDFSLPAVGSIYESEIVWTCAPAGYLTPGAPVGNKIPVTVTRPPYGQPDIEVTLTATITRGAITDSRIFPAKVMHADQALTPDQKAQEDASLINLGSTDAIVYDFTLPSTGAKYGSAISWASSSALVSIGAKNGGYYPAAVTAVSQDTAVTLTATVECDGGRAVKGFVITLVPQPPVRTDYTLADDTFDGGGYVNPGDLLGTADNPKLFANWYMINGSNRGFNNLMFKIDTEGQNGRLVVGRSNPNYYSIEAYRPINSAANRVVTITSRMRMDFEEKGGGTGDLTIGDIDLYGTNNAGSEVLLARFSKVYNNPNLISATNTTPVDSRVERADPTGNAIAVENLASDVWYEFTWEIDLASSTIDMYVNGERTIARLSFMNPAAHVSRLRLNVPSTKRMDGDTGGAGYFEIDWLRASEYASVQTALQEDLAALLTDDLSAVTGNLNLPISGPIHRSSIVWTSDMPDVISPTGAVQRPYSDAADQTVRLTAHVSLPDSTGPGGMATSEKTFTVTVKKMSTNREMALADLAALDIPAVVLTDLDLSASGLINSTELKWSSSLPAVLSPDGTVTRPRDRDATVTLTVEATGRADIHSDLYSTSSQYEITVRALPDNIPEEETSFADTLPLWWYNSAAAPSISSSGGAIHFAGEGMGFLHRDIVPVSGALYTSFVLRAGTAADAPFGGSLDLVLGTQQNEIPLTLRLRGGALYHAAGSETKLFSDIPAGTDLTVTVRTDLRQGTGSVTIDTGGATPLTASSIALLPVQGPVCFVRFIPSADAENSFAISSFAAYPLYDYEVQQDVLAIQIPEQTISDFTVPLTGAKYASQIVWTSNKPGVIRIDGGTARVTRPDTLDSTVTLSAELTLGRTTRDVSYDINVPGQNSGGTTGGSGGSRPSSNTGGGGGGSTSTVPVLPLPTPGPADTTGGFADLDEAAWAKPYISALSEQGIVNGRDATHFAPNETVKREEFVKMLVEAFGLTDNAASTQLTDVDAGAWYYGYIASAQAAGIVTGREDGTFGVGDNISRQEMSAMAYRAAQATKRSLPVVNPRTAFTDDSTIAEYAKEAVYQMQAADILNGVGDGMFDPLASATRAQAAKIIYMLMNL